MEQETTQSDCAGSYGLQWHPVATPDWGGALTEKMCFYRGKKSQNLTKLAHLCHFLLRWGKWGGGRGSDGRCPLVPLWCRHCLHQKYFDETPLKKQTGKQTQGWWFWDIAQNMLNFGLGAAPLKSSMLISFGCGSIYETMYSTFVDYKTFNGYIIETQVFFCLFFVFVFLFCFCFYV